ncbi:MAG: hypothetical protein KF812_00660 [Fimbriimonadaceae bacterium]|nr:hypothetical protein [Fimbriimonadaceae bacterium]
MNEIYLQEQLSRIRKAVVSREVQRLAQRAWRQGGRLRVDLSSLSPTMVEEIRYGLRQEGFRFAARRGNRFTLVYHPALPLAA